GVDSKLTLVLEVTCTLRVIAEDAARRRYFEPKDEREAAEPLYISRANMRDSWVRSDVGVVVEKDRQPSAEVIEEIAYLSLEEANNVTAILNRKRSDDGGVRAGIDCAFEVCKRLRSSRSSNTRPCLDGQVLAPQRGFVNSNDFIGFDLYDPLSLGV